MEKSSLKRLHRETEMQVSALNLSNHIDYEEATIEVKVNVGGQGTKLVCEPR